jgi:hypothetical protein
MTFNTPSALPTEPAAARHTTGRGVLLVLAVLLAALMAVLAVTAAVSSVQDVPSVVPPAPLPTRSAVDDNLRPNQGWVERDPAVRPAPALPNTADNPRYRDL